jgi:hypothetical protein
MVRHGCSWAWFFAGVGLCVQYLSRIESTLTARIVSLISGSKTWMLRLTSTKTLKRALLLPKMRRNASINRGTTSKAEPFVPLVVLVDGLLAPEAANTLKQIGHKLSDKRQCPYSAVFGYVHYISFATGVVFHSRPR